MYLDSRPKWKKVRNKADCRITNKYVLYWPFQVRQLENMTNLTLYSFAL